MDGGAQSNSSSSNSSQTKVEKKEKDNHALCTLIALVKTRKMLLREAGEGVSRRRRRRRGIYGVRASKQCSKLASVSMFALRHVAQRE
jgi:hypothetical protein